MSATYRSSKIIAAALPEQLPIFPLKGTVLLPQARLPLNIFEPRYLSMVEDALGKGRMIGMIQPMAADDSSASMPSIYSVGCAGRITSFNETEDGRMLIVLTGICRFRVAQEMRTTSLYRSVTPDWKTYLGDLDEGVSEEIDRERLIELLQIYFRKNSIYVDWDTVKNTPNEALIPTIIMISPLEPNEKQALLEVQSFGERARMLVTLLEMAVMPQSENEAEVRH